jgi:eukaryotic-like serine/threonine-protein kinase
MESLRRLIREVHRRSLWQVLAVYAAGSWIALQVVGLLTQTAGLPDWVPPTALVLLIIGLPLVLATAVVQEGGPTPVVQEGGPTAVVQEGGPTPAPADAPPAPPPRPRSDAPTFFERFLTWKRAMLVGVLAFALLGLAVTGYFVMRVAGIGPVASLVAQGTFEAGEPIVLADFENASDDPRLGAVVTGALRTDLATSPILTLIPDGQIHQALLRMERDPDLPLRGPLAREVALREGVKAVLEGEVGTAGSGYIISASLVAASDGRVLASFRRTARGPDEVIDAIDALSRDIREKAGESLRAIRSGPPLSQVTTRSLDALQRFTEGERLFDRGDERGAIALLEQAVALDPDFAMAWRKLAVAFGNLGIEVERRNEAVERAYGLRERLTELERYLAEGLYHRWITGDQAAEQRAYENALRLDPLETTALNNLALIYSREGREDRAEELYRRSMEGRSNPSGITYQNLVSALLTQGKLAEAVEVLRAFEEALPDDPRLAASGFWALFFFGDLEGATELARSLADDPDLPPIRRLDGTRNLALALATRGQLAEADRRAEASASLARTHFGPGEEYVSRWIHAGVVGVAVREPAVARVREERLWREVPTPSVGPAFDPFWMHALVRFTLGDAPGLAEVLERWQAALSTQDPEARAAQEAVLALYRRWLEGGRDDPEGMLEALDRYENDHNCHRCLGDLRPRFLEEAGRHAEALEAWQDLRLRPLQNWLHAAALLPVAHREVARLAEMVGDTALAVEGYRAFIAHWAQADPELQPTVEAARARLAALTAGG